MAISGKVEIDDLDWELAKKHGLTQEEADLLSYFADIESQTVFYFLEFARLKVARVPEYMAFLTMWNYEEYFHSRAISKLISACGIETPAPGERSMLLRSGARLKARVEDSLQSALATVAPKSFVALWMTWGSSQELLTSQAYEEIAHTTKNPVCAELCRRIAKQERRHFAYYYAQARVLLADNPRAQWLVRNMMHKLWSPVGNGVKTPEEAAQGAANLFPGARFDEVLSVIDRRVGALPGMEGFSACTDWAKRMNLDIPVATMAAIEAEDTRAQSWARSA